MADLYDPRPPHPCERLARLEGQSNFLSLLSGVEAGPDTTEDAGALAFARKGGGVAPEFLEAFWGGSTLYRRELCQVVFDAIDRMGRGVAEKDRVWVKGAVLDAFELFGGRYPEPGRVRAKRLRARYEDYLATRKLAEGLFHGLAGTAQATWLKARFRWEL